MHPEAMQFLKGIRKNEQVIGPVLEIGSININGSARDVYGDLQPYHGVDIVSGPNVDYVIDIRKIKNPAETPLNLQYHTIICTEVLEHVDPMTLVPAMFQFMHDRCKLIITCAGPKRKPHSADGAPKLKKLEYYANVDAMDLRSLLINPPSYLLCTGAFVATSPDDTDIYSFAEYQRTR